MKTINAKPYLDYLDKEMNIMGILSFFAIAIASFIAKLAFERSDNNHLDIAHISIFLFLIASLFFYRQRSYLAWVYGEICLSESENDQCGLRKGLDEAYSWTTWIYYRWGFSSLFCAFSWFFIYALCGKDHKIAATIIISLIVLVALIYGITANYALKIKGNEEDAYSSFFDYLIRISENNKIRHRFFRMARYKVKVKRHKIVVGLRLLPKYIYAINKMWFIKEK